MEENNHVRELRLKRDRLAEACEILLGIIQEKQMELDKTTQELRALKFGNKE